MRRSMMVPVIALVGLSILLGVGAADGWLPETLPAPLDGNHAPSTVPTYYLNLTIQTSPTTGLDELTPANFTLPLNARVVVRIVNFDTGANPVNSMWGQVMGAASGLESVSFGDSANAVTTSWISGSNVSHTLTIAPFGWSYNGSMTNGSGGMMGSNDSGWTGTNGSGGMMGGGSGMMGGGSGMMGGGSMGSILGTPAPTLTGLSGMMVNLPIPPALNGSNPAVVVATLDFATGGTYHWWCQAPCDPAAMTTAGDMRGMVTVG